MQASIRSQRTSLVPLFKLADKVTEVRMEVLDIIEACKVTVFGEDDAKAKFIDCGLGGVSAMLPSLQSPPKFG